MSQTCQYVIRTSKRALALAHAAGNVVHKLRPCMHKRVRRYRVGVVWLYLCPCHATKMRKKRGRQVDPEFELTGG